MEKTSLLDGIAGLFQAPSGVSVNGFTAVENSDIEDDENLYEEAFSQVGKVKLPDPKKKKIESDDDEDDINNKAKQKKTKSKPKKNFTKPDPEEIIEDEENDGDEIINDDEDDIDIDDSESENEVDEDEVPQIGLLFNAIAEEMGLQISEDDDLPNTPEKLVKFFVDLVNESSVPTFASEEVKQLDEFVRNGGKLEDFIGTIIELDVDTIDIEIESNQKRVLREFLSEKGFTEKQIQKKLDKYIDAEILEDEAKDALEYLKEIKETKKEQLLEDQKKQKQANIEAQQKWVEDVVKHINTLDNFRGIPVPKKDKDPLIAFILNRDVNGQTEFNRKYAENPINNFIYMAYSLMKGDQLTETAQKMGKSSAMKALRQSLSSSNAPKSKRPVSGNQDWLFSKAAQKFSEKTN